MIKEMNRFAYNPTNIDITRSKFKRKHSYKTTYNTGHIIPIYWKYALPGDTVKMEMSEITRMQTPIFPIMDNAFIDTYAFSVPIRLLWDHWEEFMGENKTGIWDQKIEYEVPQIQMCTTDTLGSGTPPYFSRGEKYYTQQPMKGSLADYLGIPISDANKVNPKTGEAQPVKKGKYTVSALPFRAYYEIYNQWFRSENLMIPKEYDHGDATVIADINGDFEASAPLWAPFYAAKLPDVFTMALPQPQKGPDVLMPIGGYAPVVFGDKGGKSEWAAVNPVNTNYIGMEAALGTFNYNGINYAFTNSTEEHQTSSGTNNLLTDLSAATGATINALRQSFAVQKFYEKQARGGTRYTEQIKSFFGVTSPDARLQRPEYLGGCRKLVNIDQVVQTSATGTETPQGNTAAYSLTTQNEHLFTKSFVEHEIIMIMQVIRPEHSYQDGLAREWSQKTLFDFYNPTFANLGEMAIMNKEIFLAGEVENSKDEQAFGYQEAWYWERYEQNMVTGEFRSDYFQSLDAWHWADNYYGLPGLNSGWLEQMETEVTRTIAVSEEQADQWLCDIFFESTWTRPMPMYSIPGLIDHH
ncbi:major capsid protein [Capybara microvirus Cap3_SP_481]|nr:major capsid protein [Capybara microvirus Cap3_SP_481]